MQKFSEFLIEEAKKVDGAKDKNKELAKIYSKSADHHIKVEKKIATDMKSGSNKQSKDDLKILAAHHGWARHHYSKAALAYRSGNDVLGDAHLSHAKDAVGKAVEMQKTNNTLAHY